MIVEPEERVMTVRRSESFTHATAAGWHVRQRREGAPTMGMAVLLWLCALPLVALPIYWWFGARPAAVAAVVLLIVAIVVCLFLCTFAEVVPDQVERAEAGGRRAWRRGVGHDRTPQSSTGGRER